MRKHGFAKAAVWVLEVLSALWLVWTIVYGIPAINQGLGNGLTVFRSFFDSFTTAFNQLFGSSFVGYPEGWGLIVSLVILLVLQLLTIWPIVALTKKTEEGLVGEAKAGQGESVVPFMNRKGDFGRAVIKGNPTDPTAKYFEGLNPTQAEKEFDWRNYAGGRPVGRVIAGSVLGVLALVALVFRFLSHIPSALGSFGSIYSGALSGLDRWLDWVETSCFGAYQGVLGTVGSDAIVAADVLDLVLWAFVLFSAIMLILLAVSFFVWVFRKPLGQKRARKALNAYYQALFSESAHFEFNADSDFAVVGAKPKDAVPSNPVKPASQVEPLVLNPAPKLGEAKGKIDDYATGVSEVSPVMFDAEGNVIDRSVASYSVDVPEDDLLIINPTLLSSITGFTPRAKNSYAYERTVPSDFEPEHWYELGAKEAPKASDRKPGFWYDLGQAEAPAILWPISTPADKVPPYWYAQAASEVPAPVYPVSRPSDKVPPYWYESAKHEFMVSHPYGWLCYGKPDIPHPYTLYWLRKVPEAPKVDGEFYARLANAIEPFVLEPVKDNSVVFPPKPVSLALYPHAPVVVSHKAVVVKAPLAVPPLLPTAVVVRPSDQTPSYWFVLAYSELTVIQAEALAPVASSLTAPVSLSRYDRGHIGAAAVLPKPLTGAVAIAVTHEDWELLEAIEPSSLSPVAIEGATPSETLLSGLAGIPVEPVATAPVYSFLASNRTSDFWYSKAAREAAVAAPFVFVPHAAKATYIPVVFKPADRTPAYWYGHAAKWFASAPKILFAHEAIAQANAPVGFVPSLQEPIYWLVQALNEATQAHAIANPYLYPAHKRVIHYEQGHTGAKAVAHAPLTLAPHETVGSLWTAPVSGGASINAIVAAIEPSHLTPVQEPWAEAVKAAAPVAGQTVSYAAAAGYSQAPVAMAPQYAPIASSRTPDYWYAQAKASYDFDRVVQAIEPSRLLAPDFDRIVEAIEPSKLTGVKELQTVRASDLASEDYYALATQEALLARPISQAADKVPPYWYWTAQEEIDAIEAAKREANAVSNKPASYFYGLATQEAIASLGNDRASDKPASYWYGLGTEEAIASLGNDRPSDKTPDYWYGEATDEAIASLGTNRPSDKTPDYWYGPATEAAIATLGTDRASDKTPDYWYDEATKEAIASLGTDRASDKPASYWYGLGTEEAIASLGTDRASDKTPDYWYDQATKEAIASLGNDRASDKTPDYWYGPATEAAIATLGTDRASDKTPDYWYDEATKEAIASLGTDRPSDKTPDYWYGPATEAAIATLGTDRASDKTPDYWQELATEEAIASLGTDRASDKTPDYWYGLATEAAIATLGTDRASDKTPDYWYDEATKEAIASLGTDRPSDKTPDYWYGPATEAAIATLGTDRASDKTPDYWYDEATEEAIASLGTDRPSDKTPDYWYGPATEAAIATLGTDRASDKTPDYWYDEATEEAIASLGTDRPSDKTPDYWYGPATEAAIATLGTDRASDKSDAHWQELATEEALANLPKNRASDRLDAGWYDDATQAAIASLGADRASDKTPDYWYDEATQEAIASLGNDRASDKPASYWYGLGTEEALENLPADRPSDKEPAYFYQRSEKAYQASKPKVVVPPKRPEFAKPGAPIRPITPVKPIAPAEEGPAPVEKPKVVGPIGLAHAKSAPSKIEIKPVVAKHVQFQLKAVSSAYKGELTPEEAFAKAVTNQTVIVSPVYANTSDKTDSKYLSKKEKEAKEKSLRTGYLSGTVVSDLKANEAPKAEFDKPVSAFKSIREWNKAKRDWEIEQEKAKKEQKAESPAPKAIKPIRVISPVGVKPEAKKAEESEKPEAPVAKPKAFKPVVPPIRKPKAPIGIVKPIEPVRPVRPSVKKKKGE